MDSITLGQDLTHTGVSRGIYFFLFLHCSPWVLSIIFPPLCVCVCVFIEGERGVSFPAIFREILTLLGLLLYISSTSVSSFLFVVYVGEVVLERYSILDFLNYSFCSFYCFIHLLFIGAVSYPITLKI